MGKGLAFLHKKPWHPGTFKNIEMVWAAEERQRKLLKIAAQREKKLKEERHVEELKRIQVESGLIPASHKDRLEFMYEWGNKLKQKEK